MSTATVLAGVFTVAPVLERVHRGVASTVDDRWDVKICERQDSDPTIERPGNVSLTVFGPGVAAVRRPSLFSLDEWRSDTVDFYGSGRRVSLRFPPNGERTARLSTPRAIVHLKYGWTDVHEDGECASVVSSIGSGLTVIVPGATSPPIDVPTEHVALVRCDGTIRVVRAGSTPDLETVRPVNP